MIALQYLCEVKKTKSISNVSDSWSLLTVRLSVYRCSGAVIYAIGIRLPHINDFHKVFRQIKYYHLSAGAFLIVMKVRVNGVKSIMTGSAKLMLLKLLKNF